MSELLQYIVRSLLSEGKIRYETVEKTKDGLKARLIERPGPTGLLMTTTAVSLNPENETRHIMIPVSDTPAQTRRVLRAIASEHDGSRNRQLAPDELEGWQKLQEWIDLANHKVVIPYATVLADMVPPVAVRLRRDFKAILNLIETHAILHAATRSKDEQGRIVAKIADYRAVRTLVNDLVSEGVEQTVPNTVRQTVAAVTRICSGSAADENRGVRERDNPPTATVQQVSKALVLDRSSAARRVKQALTRGYLKNLETKRGQPLRLVVGDPLPEEENVMPMPEEVLKECRRRR
jgi:hypothetical protein